MESFDYCEQLLIKRLKNVSAGRQLQHTSTPINTGKNAYAWPPSQQREKLVVSTCCVVAPLKSSMAPQNSILYPWPPFIIPWPPGGPLGPRLGTPGLERSFVFSRGKIQNIILEFCFISTPYHPGDMSGFVILKCLTKHASSNFRHWLNNNNKMTSCNVIRIET